MRRAQFRRPTYSPKMNRANTCGSRNSHAHPELTPEVPVGQQIGVDLEISGGPTFVVRRAMPAHLLRPQKPRVGHLERLEDPGREELVILDPADPLDEELEQQEPIAAVPPSGAGRRVRVGAQDALHQIASRVARVDPGTIGDVLRRVAEPARVGQQVSNPDFIP